MNDRILVVEDDDAIATGLALNLKLAGRTTSIARDGGSGSDQPGPQTRLVISWSSHISAQAAYRTLPLRRRLSDGASQTAATSTSLVNPSSFRTRVSIA